MDQGQAVVPHSLKVKGGAADSHWASVSVQSSSRPTSKTLLSNCSWTIMAASASATAAAAPAAAASLSPSAASAAAGGKAIGVVLLPPPGVQTCIEPPSILAAYRDKSA